MERNDKGGRPRKESYLKKKYQVNTKFKTEEYFDLKARAHNAALPINDFIRNCIKQSIIIQRLTPETNDLIRKLCGMANNLNQISKKANQAGYDSVRNEYLFLAKQIDMLLKYIKHDWENSNRK